MKKYDYKIESFRGDDRLSGYSKEEKYLKEMGENGWELVSVKISSFSMGADYYYWKKEIIPQ